MNVLYGFKYKDITHCDIFNTDIYYKSFEYIYHTLLEYAIKFKTITHMCRRCEATHWVTSNMSDIEEAGTLDHCIRNQIEMDKDTFDTNRKLAIVQALDANPEKRIFDLYAVSHDELAYESETYSFGFVLNFDKNLFEIYQGKIKVSDMRGRYPTHCFNVSGYYGMALIDEIPFKFITPQTYTSLQIQLQDLFNSILIPDG